jgi:hypothetical protein
LVIATRKLHWKTALEAVISQRTTLEPASSSGKEMPSGLFSGNNTSLGSLLSFTFDVLNFADISGADFSMGLSTLTPAFLRSSNLTVLWSFRAVFGGQFSTDPALETSVPEPEVWALLVVGVGLVSVQVRRRSRPTSIAA